MRSHRDWLDSRHDLANIDMTVGTEKGSDFSYLPNADILLLVADSLTAHLSAGVLLKSIQGL